MSEIDSLFVFRQNERIPSSNPWYSPLGSSLDQKKILKGNTKDSSKNPRILKETCYRYPTGSFQALLGLFQDFVKILLVKRRGPWKETWNLERNILPDGSKILTGLSMIYQDSPKNISRFDSFFKWKKNKIPVHMNSFSFILINIILCSLILSDFCNESLEIFSWIRSYLLLLNLRRFL